VLRRQPPLASVAKATKGVRTVLLFPFPNAVFVQDGKSVDQLRLETLVLPSTVSDAHCHIIATGANTLHARSLLQCSVFSARMEGYTGSLNRGGPTSKSSCLPEHARRF